MSLALWFTEYPFSVGESAVVKTGTICSSLSKTVTLEFSQTDPAEVKKGK